MNRQGKIISDSLNEKGEFFSTKSVEIDRIIEELDEAKVEVMQIWKGSSSNSILRQYEELRPSVSKFVELSQEIGEQLKNIAQTIEEVDIQIVNQTKL